MPSDILARGGAEAAPTRPDRPEIVAFLADAESEATLRDGLLESCPNGVDVRRAGIRAAIAALQKMPSPRTLIVDVSGEDQPLTALDDLSQVVEPDVRVLVVGDRTDANFYRQVTRGLGALEYLYKPLQRDIVARHFGPLVLRRAQQPQGVHGGRVVTLTGVRGGAGASTLATGLAWHFGALQNRHTVLLDADLHRGTCALMLGARSGPGLRTALETPQRIDELFVERAAQPLQDRLHVLAAEEKLTDRPICAEGAVPRLLDALRRRYNFVICDAPFSDQALHRDLLAQAHLRVLVMDPTLASVRDTLRLLALPNGALQARRALVVLNRAGRPGGLTRPQVEDALKMTVDIAVPDLPRQIGRAATLGDPAIAVHGKFRAAIELLAREVAPLPGGELAAAVESAPRRQRFRFALRR